MCLNRDDRLSERWRICRNYAEESASNLCSAIAGKEKLSSVCHLQTDILLSHPTEQRGLISLSRPTKGIGVLGICWIDGHRLTGLI